MNTTYNRKLAAVILVIAIIVSVRLYLEAGVSDNWRGFAYSLLHVIIVGAGSYFALKSSAADSVTTENAVGDNAAGS